MKRLLINGMSVFLLCAAPVAYAEDDDNGKKKKSKATEDVVISTVEVVEVSDDGEGDGANAKGKVTIEINGKKREFKIGDNHDEVVKKIHQVIKDGDHETSIRATIIGHGMIVGPDGEKKKFEFGDPAANKKMLEGLPKEVRIRVEKAMKDSAKGAIFGQGLMIGPDGAKKIIKLGDGPMSNEVLDKLPKEARKMIEQAMKEAENVAKGGQGRAIFIGPDGVKKELNFGDAGIEDIDIDLDIVEKLPKTLQYRIQRLHKDDAEINVTKKDPLVSKLDLILKRLDKIEKELEALKDDK